MTNTDKRRITAEILDLCDKRRELRKKKIEPEGSEKYRQVKNKVKKCMEKAKENWMGEQCSETEENLKKKNQRAYQLVKDLTIVKRLERYYYTRPFRRMPYRRRSGTEPMDRTLP